MKKIVLVFFCAVFLSSLNSCVQQSEYDKLSEENKELREQLDELENGAVRLYGQAVELSKNNELENAEEKLKILFDRHSETDESKKGRLLAIQIKSKKIEITNYKNALSINTLESLEKYIADNPKGRFVSECKKNIALVIKENEQKDKELDDFLNNVRSNSRDVSTPPKGGFTNSIPINIPAQRPKYESFSKERPSDMYHTLSSGKQVAKYEHYIPGADNNELSAQNQTAYEQVIKALKYSEKK